MFRAACCNSGTCYTARVLVGLDLPTYNTTAVGPMAVFIPHPQLASVSVWWVRLRTNELHDGHHLGRCPHEGGRRQKH